MRKSFFGVLAILSFVSSVLFSTFATNHTLADDSQIKIMCIGDSITDGYGVSGSYRKFLYHYLTEKNYSVDMIGSKEGWNTTYTDETSGETFNYDDGNTGYSGYSIKSYNGRNGIYETLVETNCLSQNPDIVILQIGTNNIIDNHSQTENSADIAELMTYILDNIPLDSVLFVTTIPNLDPNRQGVYDWFSNYRHSPDWQTQYDDDTVENNVASAVKTYNEDVLSQISAINSPRLFSADINSVITDVKTQLGDGVHPNNVGYQLMGKYWADVIDNFLSKSDVQPSSDVTTQPAVTTETVTTEAKTPDISYSVSDLVRLAKFLVCEEKSLSDDDLNRMDTDKNNTLDIFDLIIMRKILINYI